VFLDKLRDMVMQMREKRRTVAEGLQGCILPSVIKELNKKARGCIIWKQEHHPL
jgi:hypothetical protein